MSVIDLIDTTIIVFQESIGSIAFFNYKLKKIIGTIKVLSLSKASSVKIRRTPQETFLLVSGDNENKAEVYRIVITESNVSANLAQTFDTDVYDIDLAYNESDMNFYFYIVSTKSKQVLFYNQKFAVEKTFKSNINKIRPTTFFNYKKTPYVVETTEGSMPTIVDFNSGKSFCTLNNFNNNCLSTCFDEDEGILYSSCTGGFLYKHNMSGTLASTQLGSSDLFSIISLGKKFILIGGNACIYIVEKQSMTTVLKLSLGSNNTPFVNSCKNDDKFDIIGFDYSSLSIMTLN